MRERLIVMEDELLDASREVIHSLNGHPGIETKIRARGKFELYFHLELIKAIRQQNPHGTKCWSEVEMKIGTRRRSPTLDLVIKSFTDNRYTTASVEVKMIVTNYGYADNKFIPKKIRNVTNAVDSFIKDVDKHLAHKDDEALVLELAGTPHRIDKSYSLAIVYPMPQDLRSEAAWKKHIHKMERAPKSRLKVQEVAEFQFGSETVPVGIYILESNA